MGRNVKRYRIAYCTTSKYKREEVGHIARGLKVSIPSKNGQIKLSIDEVFEFDFRPTEVTEILENDLSKMVYQKAIRAYEHVKVPCIVEHAGLVLADYVDGSYPGGLTQPMWDALTPNEFLREFGGAQRRVVARAVIGFCNGKNIRIFDGETAGILADEPRGARAFYWDTIFCPDNEDGTPGTFTYAEIADDPSQGLARKAQLSQSGKALQKFIQAIIDDGQVEVFRIR